MKDHLCSLSFYSGNSSSDLFFSLFLFLLPHHFRTITRAEFINSSDNLQKKKKRIGNN